MKKTVIILPVCLMLGGEKSSDYKFVPETARYVALKRGDTYSIGKLDQAGNFLPDPRWLDVRGDLSAGVPFVEGLTIKANVTIYEYRSGRLILGKFDEKGNFIPKLGSKVIDFKDYRYSKEAPRIYNLPGRFVPKEKKDNKK